MNAHFTPPLVGRLLLIFSLLGSLYGCSSDSPEQPEPKPRPTIVFSMQGDTAQYRDSVLFRREKTKKGAEAQASKIVFNFPRITQFSRKAVKDSLNKAILNLMLLNEFGEIAYQSLEQRQADFLSEYEMSKAEMADLGADFDMKWSCEVAISVLLNTPNLLSLRFYESNFTGGAHANMSTRYLNFNMQTGKTIDNQELFAPNVSLEKQLLPIVEAKFKKYLQAQELSPEDFEFEQGAFILPKNIAIGKRGLLLAYDPYEIGAYSLGSVNLEIPYEDIYPILNKNLLR